MKTALEWMKQTGGIMGAACIERIQSDASGELRARAEKAEAACAEMRNALIPFQCETCNGTHKFKYECQSCLSGEGECTCDKQDDEPCPQCQSCEGIKQIYSNLERAISCECGKGWLSPEKAKRLRDALVDCICSMGFYADLDQLMLSRERAQRALAETEDK